MASEEAVVRSVVIQNYDTLTRHLILSQTVVDQLRAQGVIPDIVRRKILTSPVYQQAPLLLECLQRQGLPSLRSFVHVLRTTGHGWLADRLTDTDVTLTPPPHQTTQTASSSGDIAQKYGSQRYTSKPNVTFSTEPRPGILRNSVSAGAPLTSGGVSSILPEAGVSLGAVLSASDPASSHGRVNTGALLAASDPPDLNLYGGYMPGGAPPHRMGGDITNSLYGLNQAFTIHHARARQELSILQQEQTAIQQLMDQNQRNQGAVRRQQQAVQDITERLHDIRVRAHDIHPPSVHPAVQRYRLQQLNQIPWQAD